jgi:hypothetical protein
MNKTGIGIGIMGGLGLGLLLGNEFSSSYVAILGAIILGIALLSLIILSYKGRK